MNDENATAMPFVPSAPASPAPVSLTDKERQIRGMDALGQALAPVVAARMSAAVAGKEWLPLYEAKESARRGHRFTADAQDPRLLLRILRFERGVFTEVDSSQRAWIDELIQASNMAAHSRSVMPKQADRALDTMSLLAESLELADALETITILRADSSARSLAGVEQKGLDPDRSGRPPKASGVRPPDSGPTRRGLQRLCAQLGELRVEVQVVEAINFALVHNGISPVRDVRVHNAGQQTINDVRLELTIASPLPEAPLAAPLVIDIEQVPAEAEFTVPLSRLTWRLSSAPFVAFDEAVGTQLSMTAETESMTFTDSTAVRLLTADEWWAAGLRETLAAFVRPNEQAIGNLLKEASELLASRTGSPALDGYQTGPERVHWIAEAIYDALQAAQIRYVEPPPSFEGTGQRIRSHADVVEDKNGTCLDLAVLYAACLELAGLHPVTVLTMNHALTGYLTEDQQLPDASVTQEGAIATIFDSDIFEPVETTAVCAREERLSFDQARAAARKWRTTHLEEVVSLLDVHAAHRVVKPLPNIRLEGGVRVVEVVKETPAVLPTRRLPRHGDDQALGFSTSAPARVERWRRSLLDMTYLNPLLKLKKASSLLVHVPTDTLAAFEDEVARNIRFTLVAQNALAEVHVARGTRTAADIAPDILRRLLLEEHRLYVGTGEHDYHSKLRGFARKAKTALEETGTDSLYLTIGTLEWNESGKEGKAPLFLVPVKLAGGRGTTPFTLALDETRQVEPNYCLVEKLRVSWGLQLPELINPGEDESGMDIEGALSAVRSALLRKGMVNHHVEETAHLAMLQFSTLEMWRDLGENWSAFMKRSAVSHLVETPGQPFVDPVDAPAPDATAEAVAYLPIPADGSQIEAVRWAAAGKSFILEGPPGTGKSQTITNLVAHLLAEGKKVLFVAEKQAALDVVKARLDHVGLGAFSLDIHGKTQTVKAVREQISEAMDVRTESSSSWATARAQFRGLVDSLSNYPQLLHEPGPADMSAWQARQVVLDLQESAAGVDSARVPRAIAMGTVPLEQIYGAGRDLGGALGQLGVSPQRSPWRLAGPVDPTTVDRAAVSGATERLLAAEDAVGGAIKVLTDHARSKDEFDAIFRWVESVRAGNGRPCAEAREIVTPTWRNQAQEVRAAILGYQAMHRPRLAPLAHAALTLDLDALLARAIEADGKLFGKKKRRLAIVADLAHVLQGGPSALPPAEVTDAVRRALSARDDLARLTDHVRGLRGITVPFQWNPLDPTQAQAMEFSILGLEDACHLGETLGKDGRDQRAAQLAADTATQQVLTTTRPSDVVPGSVIHELALAWAGFAEILRVTESDLEFWLGERNRGQAVAESRAEWDADASGRAFIRLQRWLSVRTAIEMLTSHGVTSAADRVRSGDLRAAEVETAIRLGVAEEILAERLEATGLDGFDDAERERLIDRFVATGEDVRQRMLSELPARIVAERTIETDQPRGKVADLRAQLTRRRGGLSIRQLLEEYGPIITQITPCFLMSPTSVARFLPANAVEFDVVVFDEASQIRVPDAIGAMGRGKAVVIVGDSQQMPPSSTFGAAARDEDETGLPTEEQLAPRDLDSILTEGVESRLPRLLLTWHYRSRDEALIAFSNKSFYEGRLSSFPTPPDEVESSAVELRRVNGTWEGGGRGAARVNRAEAEAVVREVQTLLRADDKRSIGIVTFNTQQRDLILDALDAERERSAALEAAMSRGEEPLFVKNLENVQGDERDVILFTLAFAKDARGRVPLNWGPLSRAGGEKRLNVAITRAKEKVTIFASFDPHEMDLSGSNSLGLARMKDYLLLAKHGVGRVGLQRKPARDWHLGEIETALEKEGLEVRTAVGLSDFTVDLAVRASEEHAWVGVLLDGPTWAQRSSVGDRDGLPRAVLMNQMGWARVERVWLPTWLRDSDGVVAAIVESARATTSMNVSQASAVVAVVPQPEDAASGAAAEETDNLSAMQPIRSSLDWAPSAADDRSRSLPQGVARFAPASHSARHASTILDMTGARVKALVHQEIRDIVAAEGPIIEDRLLKLVAARFGFGTLRASRRDQLQKMVPRGMVKSAPNRDRVAWPDDADPADYQGYRVPEPGEQRDLAEVPYAELRNALVRNVRAAHSLSEDDALREVAREFGYSRFASKARARLAGVVDAAVQEGAVIRRGVYLEI